MGLALLLLLLFVVFGAALFVLVAHYVNKSFDALDQSDLGEPEDKDSED